MSYLSGKALIEHWDGRSWRRVPVRLPAGISALIAVAAVSRRDAWAVGIAGNTTTLTLHWDGSAWRHSLHSPNRWIRAVQRKRQISENRTGRSRADKHVPGQAAHRQDGTIRAEIDRGHLATAISANASQARTRQGR
jgi:hypothetical protein